MYDILLDWMVNQPQYKGKNDKLN